MDTPIQESMPASEPSEAPVAQSPAQSPDVIVISRALLNYIAIAIVCLLVGVVVGMVAQDRITQGNQAVTQAIIDRSVASAIAALPKDTTVQADPNARKDVSIDNRPSLGSHDAPVVIVEFGDFHCTYCKRFHDETITPLLQNYGDKVLFVFRDYPILGPDSTQAALAAECAYDQDAFWNFHDRLFSDPTELTRPLFIKYAQDLKLDMDKFTSCYDNATHQTEISKDYNDATALGVGATPTFFINGKMLLGAQPYASFAAVIDSELASAANDTTKSAS